MLRDAAATAAATAADPRTRELLLAFRDIGRQGPPPAQPLVSTAMDIHAIEIGGRCNLMCPMCESMTHTDRKRDMDMDTFEKTLRYMSRKGLKSTCLHTINEPLLSQGLDEYLALMNHYGIRVMMLSTNAQLLHKKLDVLLAYADIIDQLRLSVEGATKATYELLRPPGKFERLLENLELLREVNRHEQFFPVHMNTAVSRDNLGEMGLHFQLYSRYVRPENIHLNLVNRVSTDRSYFDASRIIEPTSHFAPCPMPFHNLYVLSNGDIAPCCRGKLPLGNIRTHDPDGLINAPELIEIRRLHLERRMPEDLPCSECEQVEPRILAMFLRYSSALRDACRHGGDWDVESLQAGFDAFFQTFRHGWPAEEAFLPLLELLPAGPGRPAQPGKPRPFTLGVFGDSLPLPRGASWGDVPLNATYAGVAQAELRRRPGLERARALLFCRRSRGLPASVEALEKSLAAGQVDAAVLHGGIVDCCPRVFNEAERANLAQLPQDQRGPLLAWAGENRPRLILARDQVCRTPLAQYEAALRRACEACLEHGGVPLALVTIAPASEAMEERSPGLRANIEAYNQAIRQVAQDYAGRLPLLLLDVYSLAQEHGPGSFLLADHQHISRAGGAVLGPLLADFAAGFAASRSKEQA